MIVEGQAQAVAEGEEILPGVKVEKVSRDKISLVGPGAENGRPVARRRVMKKAVALIALAGALWSCAGLSQSYKFGNEAEINKNWDEAIKLYERAALENPKEPVYRLALLRARSAAGLATLQTARSLVADGQSDAAIAAYKKTLSYDPLNRAVRAEMEAFASPPPVPPAKSSGGDLESPIKLKASDEKVMLKFADAPRYNLTALGKHAGMNFIYDEQFRDVPMTIDLTDRTFEQAVSFSALPAKISPGSPTRKR